MIPDLPSSIRDINRLDLEEKQAIYRLVVPDWVWEDFGINPETAADHGQMRYLCPAGSRAMEISIRLHPADRDPILYMNMADTFNNQLLVLLVVVNDPKAERYNVDVDEHGNRTNYGTTGRNIPAELAAMRAGLAPGQIRPGLRAFRRSVPVFENFVSRMGHDLFLIEPLAYHNAIVFERYGFNYIRGLADMKEIHQEFQEGGELFRKLSDENPFRPTTAWNSVRGRSWAIHDGILGHPFTGFQMYKRIGHHAGVRTALNATW